MEDNARIGRMQKIRFNKKTQFLEIEFNWAKLISQK